MKNFLISCCLFFLSFFIFTFSVRYFDTVDSYPTNLTALNLIFNQRLDLTNLRDFINERHISGILVYNSSGQAFSKMSPLLGIISVPLFVVLNAYFGVAQISDNAMVFSNYSQYVGKINAAFYASFSGVLLFFSILKLTKSRSISTLLTCVYLFATSILSTAAQANWQHAISVFFINLFLWVFLKEKTKRSVLISGLVLGVLAQIRMTNIFYGAFGLIYLYLETKKSKNFTSKATLFAIGILLTYVPFFLTFRFFDIPFGYHEEIILSIQRLGPHVFLAFISLFISPNVGLFTFSPILLLTLLMFTIRDKISPSEKQLSLSLLSTLGLFILLASTWHYWVGGTSLEARYLLEALPIFIIYLSIVYIRFSKNQLFKFTFFIFFLASIGTHILSTVFMQWDYFPKYSGGTNKTQLRDAWQTNPTLLGYVLQKRVLETEQIYRRGNTLMIKRTSYRLVPRSPLLLKLSEINFVTLSLVNN